MDELFSTECGIKEHLEVRAIVLKGSKYKNKDVDCINEVVRFEDPEYTDSMFVLTSKGSRDYGFIENIDIIKDGKKETWVVETIHGVLKFRILNKSISEEEKERRFYELLKLLGIIEEEPEEDELNSRRKKKAPSLLMRALLDTSIEPINFDECELPWKV